MMFQPLSTPLQSGIRFLRNPLPALPTVHLTAHLLIRFPFEQQYGLTAFPICHTTGLGSAFSPIALWRRIPNHDWNNRLRTFWFKPISSFGLSILTAFISSSHLLPIPASLAPQPVATTDLCVFASQLHAPMTQGVHC